ncbi:restless-like transposase [Purpureocillium lavendulum]|uniref:Restless-like transposase n=1 Tax=Purpureocillium lavendulum TaxID=1247861 RepID=A0AB34FDI5_9HYPO|nr:restless-like transposase [Purpureocillium lavendulum]
MLRMLLIVAIGFGVTTAAHELLERDVVIVGGGASGSYAAVRLREDYGKRVALIEREEILVRAVLTWCVRKGTKLRRLTRDTKGGHVDSFVDSKTGIPYNYGVRSFIDAGNATGFFDRLSIKRGRGTNSAVNTTYIDFKTGNVIAYTPPTFPAQLDVLRKFLSIVEPWEQLIQPGYFDFPEPRDIPTDLLIPFGQFIAKHSLEGAMPFIYQTTGLGLGNITNAITLFALQAFGPSMARSTLGLQGSFVPASGRNQDLYDAIGQLLGSDVLYSCTVVNATRNDHGVNITTRNSKSGLHTTIQAKRLLVAIEPTETNTAPFHLDEQEREMLSKFTYTQEYTGIIDNEILVANTSYFNLPPNAAPQNYLSYPEAPFTARIDYMGSGHYFRVTIIGDSKLDAQGARDLVQRDFKNLQRAGILGSQYPTNERVHWVAFSAHGPMHARVSVADIQGGFFQKLYQLQGRRSTWWTGGAWSVNFQTALWQYDDILIPKILDGLD